MVFGQQLTIRGTVICEHTNGGIKWIKPVAGGDIGISVSRPDYDDDEKWHERRAGHCTKKPAQFLDYLIPGIYRKKETAGIRTVFIAYSTYKQDDGNGAR